MNNQISLKEREYWCAAHVAAASQRTPEKEPGNWPDAWLRSTDGERLPVEVVTAHQRRVGEDPKQGAPSARALKNAEQQARTLGAPAAFGTQYGRGFAIPLDGSAQLPLRDEPTDPVGWVEAAVIQKLHKAYSNATSVVLVVDFQWMPLYEFELPKLAERLRAQSVPFRELWIVTIFNGQPQRVF